MSIPTKQYADKAREFLKKFKKGKPSGAVNYGFERFSETNYIRPRSLWHSTFEDALWIVIKVFKIDSQAAIQRGSGIQKTPLGESFKFLAPMEILETLNHEWAEYDSLATRLAQKIATIQRDLSEGGQAIQGLSQEAASALSSLQKGEGAAPLQQVMQKAANRVEGISVHQRKVDAALVYTNSGRRTYQFTFNLVDEGNPSYDIIEPVSKLSSYSCATAPAHGVEFENPYIFDVRTEPNQFLVIENAALESVQPTYRGPYRDGYPTVCELTLSFKDLDPLYANNLNIAKGKVTVTSSVVRASKIPIDTSDRWLQPFVDRYTREYRELANKIPGGIKSRTLGELSGNLRNLKSRTSDKAYQKISENLNRVL